MLDLNELSLPDLYAHLRDTPTGNSLIRRGIELAREEDLGEDWPHADVTTQAFIKPWARGEARLVARQACTVCGLALLDDILTAYRADVDVDLHCADGASVAPGTVLATLRGNFASIVTAERTVLNYLMRLSGVASRTAAFVAAAGRPCIYDTRKTTPGLRLLEKYAVRCGGGRSHRLGLYDAVLIKDNHLVAMSDGQGPLDGESFGRAVKDAARRARMEAPKEGLRFAMLEVDTVDQFRWALDAGACGKQEDRINIVLLDNMSPALLKQAVEVRNAAHVPVELEASGGVTLETVAAIAATGVDRISTGSLTHGSVWVDIGLDA